MDSVKASYFKNHFGAVLDRVGKRAIRIERRGREPAVLISEAEYRSMQQLSLATPAKVNAIQRLRSLASKQSVDLEQLQDDSRAAAILAKHGRGKDS
ncbi:MAG: type II toxin-antitoxin system Phd/YefM family antitoxin [Coraliomargarita sp.]